MNRYLLSIMLSITTLLFAACGDTEEKVVQNVESGESEETEGTDSADSDVDSENAEDRTFNEVIVDNENIKATLLSVVEEKDDIWGDSIVITFEVENKRDTTIEVQAREVSADGKMIDESFIIMSTEVASGKLADAKLKIQPLGDEELPDIEENIELKLHFFSWDDYDYSEDHPVLIEFK